MREFPQTSAVCTSRDSAGNNNSKQAILFLPPQLLALSQQTDFLMGNIHSIYTFTTSNPCNPFALKDKLLCLLSCRTEEAKQKGGVSEKENRKREWRLEKTEFIKTFI